MAVVLYSEMGDMVDITPDEADKAAKSKSGKNATPGTKRRKEDVMLSVPLDILSRTSVKLIEWKTRAMWACLALAMIFALICISLVVAGIIVMDHWPTLVVSITALAIVATAALVIAMLIRGSREMDKDGAKTVRIVPDTVPEENIDYFAQQDDDDVSISSPPMNSCDIYGPGFNDETNDVRSANGDTSETPTTTLSKPDLGNAGVKIGQVC